MLEDKEDDIEIDFGKIKNFFKGKKKDKGKTKEVKIEKTESIAEPEIEEKKVEEQNVAETKPKVDVEEKEIKAEGEETDIKEGIPKEEERETKKEVDEETEDEDIEFDLGKIKNLFKGKAKEDTGQEKGSKPEDDEEISIDFGKLTSLFKKKKETHAEPKEHPVTEKEETDDDSEISLDFGKITSIFKSKKEKKEGKEDSEEISLDIKKTYKSFVKKKSFWIPLVLILFAMSLSIFLRVESAYLPLTEQWGQNALENFNRQVVSADINSQYPNLPDANKQNLIQSEIARVFASGQAYIPTSQGVQQIPYEQALDSYADSFKQRLQNDQGQTYLLAIDPYFWTRHARNVLENGHPGDELRGGIPWDNHMYAPNGRPADVSFHSYFIAYLFKFLTIFNKNLSLIGVTFFVPVIISAIAVIPAYFIGRRLGGHFGGFVSAFIVAIHPAFLGRTAGGFSDTDAYNVMFPLIIAWLFLEGFETHDLKKKITYVSFAGFFAGLYSFTWLGWWYIFDFLLLASGIFFLYAIFTNRGEIKKGVYALLTTQAIKNTIILTITFILVSGLFYSIFYGPSNLISFIQTPLQPLNFIKIKEVGITTIWPNVFTTVAEQNSLALRNVISQISLGRNFLFLIALFGIIATLIKKDENGKIDVKYAILLTIWFAATIFASTKGVRFVLLLVPAFAIAFGVGLGFIYQKVSSLITKEFHISKYISKTTLIILLSLILIGPWNAARSTAVNEIPSMNDAWWNSLENIRLQSDPDAIINSWWDFGHWFKFIADRKVTFDGTSQNSPQAHWIGNTLLTDDEDLAVGILRMVDCSGYIGGTFAFDAVQNVTNDGPKAIAILYDIMPLDKEQARKDLERKEFSDEDIEKVLEFTHCQPPENYFIASEDMVGKSGVWGHFGSWDFERAFIYNSVQQKEIRENSDAGISLIQERLNIDEKSAENLYFEALAIQSSSEANNWIAPWPSYSSGINNCNTLSSDTVTCPIGQGVAFINTTTFEARIPSGQGDVHPNSLVYATKEGTQVKEYKNNTVGVSMILIPNGANYQSVLAAPQQANSMFTRLFFLNGHGLKHFKKFSDQRSVTGSRIIVYKVDWDGKEKTQFYFPEPQSESTSVES